MMNSERLSKISRQILSAALAAITVLSIAQITLPPFVMLALYAVFLVGGAGMIVSMVVASLMKKNLLKADVEKTKQYYAAFMDDHYGYTSFRRHVKQAYPELAAWLAEKGIDIEKPLKVICGAPNADGVLENVIARYVVIGSCPAGTLFRVNDVSIEADEKHPDTGIAEEHVVLSVWPMNVSVEDTNKGMTN